MTKISMTWPQYLRSCCSFEGRELHFQPRHTEVLLMLLLAKPEFVSRSGMIERLYPDPDLEPDYAEEIIKKSIHFLRRQLGKGSIETQYGNGWRLAPELL